MVEKPCPPVGNPCIPTNPYHLPWGPDIQMQQQCPSVFNPCIPTEQPCSPGGKPYIQGNPSPPTGIPGIQGTQHPTLGVTCVQMIPPGPTNTNVVKPVLENMLRVIHFGLEVMCKNRERRFNEIKQFVMRIINNESSVSSDVVRQARDLIDAYAQQLIPLITLWTHLWDYYRHLLMQADDNVNPVPNLNCLKISPMVSQKAFKDILRGAVRFCSESIRMNQLDYVGTTQFVDMLDNYIRRFTTKMCEFPKLAHDFFDQPHSIMYGVIRRFKEKQVLVQLFLEEWKTGGENLNQPQAPDMYLCIPMFPDIDSIGRSDSTRPTPCSHDSPGSPASTLLSTSLPSTIYNQDYGPKMETIIAKFQDFENTAYVEVRKRKGHKENLDNSLAALGKSGR